MNKYAKMFKQAETENEKIFWKNLSGFMVSDVNVTLQRVGEMASMVHLDGVPYLMFLDISPKDEVEAYAYATAQATNVIKIFKLKSLEELVKEIAEEQGETK